MPPASKPQGGYYGGRQIVRVHCDHDAPTGESSVYECADGSTWRQLSLIQKQEQITGRQLGHMVGDRIYDT